MPRRCTKTYCELPASPRTKKISRGLGLVLTLAVVSSALVYLSLMSALATKGFTIKTLQNELRSTKELTQKLDVKSSELQSLPILEANIKTDGFVSVEKIEYLAAIPPEVGMAVK